MTGAHGKLIVGSLKLSLGYETNLPTNIRIPQPEGISNVTAAQVQNDNYKAFVDCRYGTKDYVFAALGTDALLIDFRAFKAALPNLPYEIPSIVKCEADEQTQTTGANGVLQTAVIHAAACAQPACLTDKRAHPGALALDFPSGAIPEVARPGDFLANTQITKSPCDRVQTCLAGDAPAGALSQTQLPLLKGHYHPLMGDVIDVALYDWIRRSGPRVKVDSLVQALNNPFDTKLGTAPQSHLYEVAPDGTVTYTVQPMTASITDCVSNDQYFAVSGLALHSTNGGTYDVFLKDYCFQPGRQHGGIHAGEPLPLVNTPVAPPASPNPVDPLSQDWLSKQGFPTGPAGGAVRPTEEQMGVATDIEMRARS
jgi:hypothetical protein